MVREILDTIRDAQLRVLIVWTPVLAKDNRQAAVEAMRLISDDRAAHYWDATKSLAKAFASVVDLPGDWTLAWDVYFLFDRNIEWNDQPPTPLEWMHQLGTDERTLEGAKLLQLIRNRLHAEFEE